MKISKLIDYSHNLYELITEMQKEITNIIRSQYEKFSENAVSNSEQIKAACPVGGDIFANSVKCILDSSNQTFTTMTKKTTQIHEKNKKKLKKKK